MDDRRVAEADVHDGRPGDPVDRPGQRRQPIGPGLVRARLHVRLVDLHDVGARCEQVDDLLVDRRGVVEGELLLAGVVVVLSLLRHRERTWHGDLDGAVGVRPQELQVADLDRMFAADLADDARHGVGVAAAVEGRPGIVDVDAVEGRGEAVRVALAAHLAVGDDVESGALLVDDGEDRGVVLGLLKPFGGDPPQLGGADTRAGSDRPVGRGRSANPVGRRNRRATSAAVARWTGVRWPGNVPLTDSDACRGSVTVIGVTVPTHATMVRRWPTCSQYSPSAWRRRSTESPVRTASTRGAPIRSRRRASERGLGARPSGSGGIPVMSPPTSSPRPTSTAWRRRRSPVPGSST